MRLGDLVVWTGLHRGPCPALAEALRRASRGERVLVAQLLRGGIGQGPSRPVRLLERLEWLRPDLGRLIDSEPSVQEADAVQALWLSVLEQLDRVDLLVLDEAGLAVQMGLITEHQLLDLLTSRPSRLEVILTGPAMPAAVEQLADRLTVERHRSADAGALSLLLAG